MDIVFFRVVNIKKQTALSMKIYFTLLMSFLFVVSAVAQQEKDIFIINFHYAKKYNSLIGKNIANEFTTLFGQISGHTEVKI
jgi:hypothetical protein